MSEELSRVEDLLENGVEQPVLPMSELEAILRGEKIKPHSRVAELLLQYNPQDILIEKRINENGTYYASADNAAGYFKVIVDTPVIPPTVLDHLVETITENGTYNYTSEHDGYSDAKITVNVPKPQPVVASKTITANGTYVAADEQLDGYSQAVVNVPPTPLDTMNITHNGTYHPPAGRGFDEVNVTVPLGTKTITENGTYTATDDNLDGYSQVTIDVAGGGGSEPSEFYRYIPAVNGTIVLRQKYTKVLGQYEVENKVFFNGYHLTDYDTIPAEIYNYIPDIDVSGANWTDNTSTTQDGWISVAKHTYNQLRCYTQSWGSYLSNIDIWAVVDFTGGNGQTLPWSDPYDVDPTPDITLINAQISSISNKYMGAISTNLPVVAGYYAISHYNSDQIAGGTNLALVKIESLPTTITLGGLANFRLNITSNSVEVDNYDGSAKDVYMSIIKIPEYAICIKPD